MHRVALVSGVRTPFVKAGGAFAALSALDLATTVTTALAERLPVEVSDIDELTFSSVLLDPRIPNLAREIVLRSKLPKTLPAHFVSNNCISGLVAVSQIASAIATGRIQTGIAGGVESMSCPALALKPSAERLFLKLARARTLSERLGVISQFRFRHLVPIPPSPKEPSTGLTMGQHCELTAQELGISREAQDLWAFQSHQRAASAADMLAQDIVSVNGVTRDTLVRSDTSLEKLAALNPVFDRSSSGSITAGNASALTDGAAALFLASEEFVTTRRLPVLAWIDGIQFSALDPAHGLLMAPVFALPQLLSRSAIRLESIDRFEIHEAFSAQVLANLQVWETGWKRYPDYKPLGPISRDRINLLGGSIALGHPFAATGGRLMLSLARQLDGSSVKRGVISVCAAGGMACALSLSVPAD